MEVDCNTQYTTRFDRLKMLKKPYPKQTPKKEQAEGFTYFLAPLERNLVGMVWSPSENPHSM